jgi:2'-5' RNA ligase
VARLFVAVVPPAEVLAHVAALPRPEVDGLRWTGPEQWHVTLRFLGRVDDVGAAERALQGVRASPTEAVLGPAIGRFGQRVLHVPVGGLDQVAAAVVAATADVGEPPEDRPFAAHLTLARSRARRGAPADLRTLAGAPVDARWTVTEVCLVESRLSSRGATYEVVAPVPLVPGDSAVAPSDRS